jgi:hypothetical protein
LEEEIARMKKNQERRLHRKNAKIAKEGGTLMTLNRPIKPDTTVRPLCLFSFLPRTFLAIFFSFSPLIVDLDLFYHLSETMRPLRPNGSHEYVKPPLPHNTIFYKRVVLTAHHKFLFSETNRKCPRWAEFNSGTQPPTAATPVSASASGPAGSPPPLTPSLSNSLGLGQSSSLHVPSPLATSPPVVAAPDDAPTAPKIKLTLKR